MEGDDVPALQMENGIDAVPDKLCNDARSFRDWTLMYRERSNLALLVCFFNYGNGTRR